MIQTILITGASSGIGQAAAHIFAKNGYQIIAVGRRTTRLKALAEALESTYGAKVLPITLDVRNQQDVATKLGNLPDEFADVTVLLNNAGLAAGKEAIQTGVRQNWERMIDTNLKGLLYVSEQIIPIFIGLKRGNIINVSSVAGRQTYSGGNVYGATKFAVEALTEGMRIDLLPHNIKVGRISPGMVNTEFSLVRFDGDKQKADDTYVGFSPLMAEDVAEAIYFMATRPAHVCINDMLIMPTAQANATTVFKQ